VGLVAVRRKSVRQRKTGPSTRDQIEDSRTAIAPSTWAIT
jgi:hypothetical protein